MELEKQVCSLELAKRLKELGVKQESLFIWQRAIFGDEWCIEWRRSDKDPRENCAAFTVAELGMMLIRQELPYYDDGEWKSAGYYDFPHGRERIIEETEADCRAAMLVYLIENGLLDVKTLNV